MDLCEYGCGQEAKYQFKNGKWCCCESHNSCLEVRRKMSKSSTNPSEETRRKKSIAIKGKRKGKTYEEIFGEEKAKILRELRRISRTGKNNPMYGKQYTEEEKGKNRESHLGEKNGFYGKKHTEESRRKNRESHLGKNLGPENPNWKGGISCEPYCDIWLDKEFKESIKERDGYKCLNPDCWKNCNHLPIDIHHIDYNKKNCKPSNLIALCRSCNSRANKDREWHEFWYKAILYRRYLL